MVHFLEWYALSIVVLSVVGIVISLKYESVLVRKKVLNEFDNPKEKKRFLFHQRINLLLFAFIALGVYCFPTLRRSSIVLGMVFVVLGRGMLINKKYLNRWKQ